MGTRRTSRVICGAVALVGLTACSSSHPRATSPAVPSASASDADPLQQALAQPSPSPDAILDGLGLQAADLPAGWVASAPASSADVDQAAAIARVAACAGSTNTYPDLVGQARSQTFTSGTSSAFTTVGRYKGADDIAADTALLSKPLLSVCTKASLREQLTAEAPATASFGDIIVRVTPGSGGGPAQVVGTVAAAITASDGGKPARLYVDQVEINSGTTEVTLELHGSGARFDPALATALIAAIAQRVASA